MSSAFTRPVEQWVEILGRTDATHESAEKAIARRILGDIIHYYHRRTYEEDDVEQLANALIAYARMVQEAGLKV